MKTEHYNKNRKMNTKKKQNLEKLEVEKIEWMSACAIDFYYFFASVICERLYISYRKKKKQRIQKQTRK